MITSAAVELVLQVVNDLVSKGGIYLNACYVEKSYLERM